MKQIWLKDRLRKGQSDSNFTSNFNFLYISYVPRSSKYFVLIVHTSVLPYWSYVTYWSYVALKSFCLQLSLSIVFEVRLIVYHR